MTRKLCLILCVATLSFAGAGASSAGGTFFSVLPDMPLPDGFNELTDSVTVFEKPHARILFVSAQSAVPGACEAARSFYKNTLPNLGWRYVERFNRYLRDAERLDISVNQASEKFCLLSLSVRPILNNW